MRQLRLPRLPRLSVAKLRRTLCGMPDVPKSHRKTQLSDRAVLCSSGTVWNPRSFQTAQFDRTLCSLWHGFDHVQPSFKPQSACNLIHYFRSWVPLPNGLCSSNDCVIGDAWGGYFHSTTQLTKQSVPGELDQLEPEDQIPGCRRLAAILGAASRYTKAAVA
jgi:hypothetical protein